MKKLITLVAGLMMIAAGFTVADARYGRGTGNAGRGWHNYDPATVEQVTGKVESVGTYDRGGIHVVLTGPSGTVEVHLGPDYYVTKRIDIAAGDTITITGSRVKYMGRDAVIARSVEKEGKTVTLRHDDGTPMWSGQGHRRCPNC